MSGIMITLEVSLEFTEEKFKPHVRWQVGAKSVQSSGYAEPLQFRSRCVDKCYLVSRLLTPGCFLHKKLDIGNISNHLGTEKKLPLRFSPESWSHILGELPKSQLADFDHEVVLVVENQNASILSCFLVWGIFFKMTADFPRHYHFKIHLISFRHFRIHFGECFLLSESWWMMYNARTFFCFVSLLRNRNWFE